jgi:hypothetical protein
LKKFKKFLQKSVDNRQKICYNDYSKREEDAKMMNWYMNAENHEEDYEELMELLKDLAEEDEEG